MCKGLTPPGRFSDTTVEELCQSRVLRAMPGTSPYENQTFLVQFNFRTGEINIVNYKSRNIILSFLTDILILFIILLSSESIKYLARTGRTILLSTASISLAPDLSH